MSFRRTALAVAGFLTLFLAIVVIVTPSEEAALDGPPPGNLADSAGGTGEVVTGDEREAELDNANSFGEAEADGGSSENDRTGSNLAADVDRGSDGNGTENTDGSTGDTNYQTPGTTSPTSGGTTATTGSGNAGGNTTSTADSTGSTKPPSTDSPGTTSATNPPVTNPPTTDAPTTNPPVTTVPAPTGAAFAGVAVADWTNSNALVTSDGQPGSFRTVCTTSHFNFDDAIVFPGQQNATHLHMYFGNTEANFASTGASLAASGDATCQGGPLNRSAYWVPAVMDANGQARPAQYMLAYYKRAGDEDVVPFPNGLKIVVGNAMAHDVQPGREAPIDAGIDYRWYCGSPITTGAYNAGRLIPNCAQGDFLTLTLIFPRCGDGRLDSADHKSHMAYPAYYGGPCPSSHPIRHPQLTYNIHWNNNDTNTAGWYLSSDDHRAHGDGLLPGGTTTHADWIGAWHPDVLNTMTTGCFNAAHDCKGGTISLTLRLNEPNVTGYSPSNIYNSGATISPLDPNQFR